MNVTVRALNRLGYKARGLVRNNSAIQDGSDLEQISVPSRRAHPIRGVKKTIEWWREVNAAFEWCDVVHWHFSDPALPLELDMKRLAKSNRPRLVEFWGSDIRIPEKSAADNQYLAKLYRDHPRLAEGAAERSRKVQERFAVAGFSAVISGRELRDSLDEQLFKHVWELAPRLFLEDYTPLYPDPKKERPVVVHMPSSLAIKGSRSVVEAVEKLDGQLDFRLIHNMPRGEALQLLRSADIMLDQFILGDFGLASLEAMALGKPTICYLKDSVVKRLPFDCPIINANPDNLASVLDELVGDGHRRHEVGRRSRAYVEQHHDAMVTTQALVDIYRKEQRFR